MVQVIGPHDGRKARKKRCDRCVERRIKCNGDYPCMNCTKTNRVCHTTTVRKATAPIFVHATQASFSQKGRFQGPEIAVPLPSNGLSSRNNLYVTYFFSSFLHQNAFTGIISQFGTALSSLIHHSVELQEAVDAISALHIAQSSNRLSLKDDGFAALQAYAQSVRLVQAKIASRSFICDPSSLWTTLLLGIFELMRDPTGANWLAHFLNGTSTMLRLQGPEILVLQDNDNEHRQTFFFSTRIFEISRALIYTEPTFLATPEWSTAIRAYWTQHSDAWSAKEALFDILPQFVDLAIHTLEFMESGQSMPQPEQDRSATSLAEEGLVLQAVLSQWHFDFLLRTSLDVENNELAAETRIAQVYYHTICIYLDGIFSYHAPFTEHPAPFSPMLDRDSIHSHVASILNLTQGLLAQGAAGILLFFPLRVAGARAQDSWTRAEILRLLETIVRRGFAVALSFIEDLSDLWAGQSN